jgi:hypothetical protein
MSGHSTHHFTFAGAPRSARRWWIVLVVLIALVVLGARVLLAQIRAPAAGGSTSVRAAAAQSTELRIEISVARRRLWVVGASGDTLLDAPVAVGSGRTLRGEGHRWTFATPRGIRTVVSKEVDPVWLRPDWAYVEVASDNHLRLDSVSAHRPRPWSDGRTLVVRGTLVGTVDEAGTFEVWPMSDEIVYDDVLYMPPIGTEHRAIHGALGAYRLNIGDAVGIHGTPDRRSIGRAVTHGCLRLRDADLAFVYETVPVGAPVFIY